MKKAGTKNPHHHLLPLLYIVAILKVYSRLEIPNNIYDGTVVLGGSEGGKPFPILKPLVIRVHDSIV